MTRNLVLSIFLAIFLPSAALAGMACGLSKVIHHRLETKYGESRLVAGLRDGNIWEVWANEAKGTWTILVTYPGDQSCIVANGTDYSTFKATKSSIAG